ncbi:MAG: molecular chaperone TorD family protein [Planctomycetes bacterium]|nr:molecular chaperone TorD family protein [Planctomycetota bacterium]
MRAPPDTNAGTSDEAIARAFARGLIYRLIGQTFQPPDAAWPARMIAAAREARTNAREAAATLFPAHGVGAALASALAAIGDDPLPARAAALQPALFGHVAGGEAPLYETEYGSLTLFQRPQVLADLAGTYRAFGLAPAPRMAERPDHLAFECEFMYVAAFKEAWALAHEQGEQAAICLGAQKLFITEHLGRWAPSFAARLAAAAPESLFARVAELLAAIVRADGDALGAVVGLPTLLVNCEPEPETPDACGPIDADVHADADGFGGLDPAATVPVPLVANLHAGA